MRRTQPGQTRVQFREVMRWALIGPKLSDPRLPRKAAEHCTARSVPQTDSGGRGEYPKARERTLVKELGKLAP